MIPSLQWKLANTIADALVAAQGSLQPATIGISHTNLTGAHLSFSSLMACINSYRHTLTPCEQASRATAVLDAART
jgi:hypothetical protein